MRADEQTTVYCIEHLRTKGTRQAFPSPVIRHGWLLIGDQGQVHFEEMVNESSVSYKMMALAKAVLTCERSNPVNILKIENGKMTFAHEDLRAHMESRGLACQFPVGELVDSEIEGGSDRPEVR